MHWGYVVISKLSTAAYIVGYYNNPEATSETIDSDGWLHSGDIEYYDSIGWIFLYR